MRRQNIGLTVGMLICGLLFLVALVVSLFYTPPLHLWGGRGEMIFHYKHRGHEVFHIRAEEGYMPTEADVLVLVDGAVKRIHGLEPEHGLYIVIQRGDEMLAVIGLTYDAVVGWEGDLSTCHVLTGEVMRWALYIPPIWPVDRMEERVIVINYAWLLCMMNWEEHPWFFDLAAGRPLPVDSAFIWGE